jgi:hypothetical protein
MKRIIIVLLFLAVVGQAIAQDKPIITVLDFSTDGVSESEMKSIISLLSSALFQTQAFTVIDVSERERLLQELEFSLSECTDESCLLEVGRMLSAEGIVVGNLGKVGNRYILSTKLLETETAKTLNTADGFYDDLDALVDDIYALANKLAAVESEGPAVAGQAAGQDTSTAAADQPRPRPESASGNYFTVTSGAGVTIVVGAVSDAMGLGVPGMVSFSYNLDRDWGILGLGVLTGVQYQATKKDARYLYTMLTVPIGAEVSYRTKAMLPFFLTGAVSGGVTLNGILYKEEYLFRDDVLNISAFAAPGVGLGYQLSPRTSLALTARMMMIFFQGSLYLGASPTFGIDIRL